MVGLHIRRIGRPSEPHAAECSSAATRDILRVFGYASGMASVRRTLYAIFAEEPEVTVSFGAVTLDGLTADDAFDRASHQHQLSGRPVVALWVCDDVTQEVRRLHGSPPLEIIRKHSSFLARADTGGDEA